MTFHPTAAAGLVALAVSGAAAYPILQVLRKAKSQQIISQHVPEHAAKQGTPTMGGIIVLLGASVGMAAFGLDETSRQFTLPILVLLLLFGLVGFADDYLVPKLKPGKRGLDWQPKLALMVLAVGLACWLGGLTDPWAILFAGITVLFFSNAYNFSDGLDGLAGGLGVILCVGLLALLPGLPGGVGSEAALAALAAAFLPFLFLNAPPARVFMGDVGALPIGAALGWVFFQLGWQSIGQGGGAFQGQDLAAILILSLVMILELVPVPLQVASAKLRKGKRLFPFRTPIHHGFQHAGWPETRVVWMFHLFQAACVLVALALVYGGSQ